MWGKDPAEHQAATRQRGALSRSCSADLRKKAIASSEERRAGSGQSWPLGDAAAGQGPRRLWLHVTLVVGFPRGCPAAQG